MYGTSLPLEFFEQWCADAFGADMTHEMLERSIAQTNIEYGGFTPAVSNVVFVHGSVDPWHAMGVLEDLSAQATSIYITGRTQSLASWSVADTDNVQEPLTVLTCIQPLVLILRNSLWQERTLVSC